MPLDLLFDTTINSATASTVTIENWPLAPYVGEVVHTRIKGDDGRGVSNVLSEIHSWTDVGEAGAVASYTPTMNAETGLTRAFCHAYSSSGAKTQTANTYAIMGGVRSKTANDISVIDPSGVTPDHEYYLSLDGDDTGFPAESSTITHILSYADLLTVGTGTAGETTHWYWRGGVSHGFAPTADGQVAIARNDAILYHTTFGTGEAQLVCAAGQFRDNFVLFDALQDDQRWIFDGVGGDGKFDPINGRFMDAKADFIRSGGSLNRVTLSVANASFRGFNTVFRPTGTAANTSEAVLGAYNVKITDWADYGLCFTAACRLLSIRCCDIRQNPIAANSVDTLANTGKPEGEYTFARHGCARLGSDSDSSCMVQCLLANTVGWSNGDDIQALFRHNMDKSAALGTFCVLGFNVSVGAGFTSHGRPDSADDILTLSELLIVGNNHVFARQEGRLVQSSDSGAGGVYGQSNLLINAKLKSSQTASFNRYCLYHGADTKPANVAAAAFDAPVEFKGNTYVSYVDNSLPQWTDSSHQRGDLHQGFVADGGQQSPAGRADLYDGNLMSGEGHNTGSDHDTSAFSKGDDYRLIDGSSADLTMLAPPPVDVTGVLRSPNGLQGAYADKATSATSVGGVANSTPPTIGTLSGQPNLLGVLDDGDWTYTDEREEWLLQWEWYEDGVQIADPHNTNVDITGKTSGTEFYCVLTRWGLDNVLVSATSNTFVVP